jgi:hypothetical protein
MDDDSAYLCLNDGASASSAWSERCDIHRRPFGSGSYPRRIKYSVFFCVTGPQILFGALVTSVDIVVHSARETVVPSADHDIVPDNHCAYLSRAVFGSPGYQDSQICKVAVPGSIGGVLHQVPGRAQGVIRKETDGFVAPVA